MKQFQAPPDDFLVSSAAGSIWTWVAVLTAAIGLWRIRAFGSKSGAPPSPISQPPPAASAAVVRSLTSPPAEDEKRPSKERFTMIYSLDSAEEGCECDGIEREEIRQEEEELAGGEDAYGELVAPLEGTECVRVWVRKISDLGLYRHQDRMAINGSVVRLWCGGLRRRV